MKYFKPELLARFRSSDDDVADAGAQEWERAAAAYSKTLVKLRPLLPSGVSRLLDRFSLHGSKILSIVESKRRPIVNVLVRLETKPRSTRRHLQLAYFLDTCSNRRAFSFKGPSIQTNDHWRIQYDEFGLAQKEPPTVFSHALLLTGDSELRIRFTKLWVRSPRRVIVPALQSAGLGA